MPIIRYTGPTVLLSLSFGFAGHLSEDIRVFGQNPAGASPLETTESTVGGENSTPTSFDELISGLGSSQYTQREKSTEELLRLDFEKLPDLARAFRESSDPEVRARLGGIIAKLKHDRNQKVVRLFLREPDPSQTHGLDGWKSFSKLAGSGRSSKRLFLMMLERYPDLVETELTTKQAGLDRSLELLKWLQSQGPLGQIEREDGLALLYCTSVADDLLDRNLERVSYSLMRSHPFTTLMRDSQTKKPVEELVRRWSLRIKYLKRDVLLMMLENDLSPARGMALELLQSPAIKEDPDAFLFSMQALFRYGLKEDLQLIETWLDDKTVCDEQERVVMPMQPIAPSRSPPIEPANDGLERFTLEFRDAALLAAVQIERGDLQSYFPGIRLHPLRGYNQQSVVLREGDSDQTRQKRIDNWRAGRKLSGSL